MTVHRALTPSEFLFAVPNVYIICRYTFTGTVDVDVLRDPLRRLLASDPALASRIAVSSGTLAFVSDSAAAVPLAEMRDGLTDELVRFIRERRCAWAAVSYGDDSSTIWLAVHHAVADAARAVAVADSFWMRVASTSAATERIADEAPREFPEALEHVIEGVADTLGLAAPPPPRPVPGFPAGWETPREVRTASTVRHRFTRDETDAIRDRATKARVSVADVVAGAAVLADAAVEGLAVDDMLLVAAMSVRQLASPPRSATEVTNGVVPLVVSIDSPADSVEAAQSARRAIWRQLSNPTCLHDGLGMLDGMVETPAAYSDSPPGVTTVSHWGEVRVPQVPGLTFIDFSSESIHCVGEVESDTDATPPGGGVTYVVTEFDGRLSVESRSRAETTGMLKPRSEKLASLVRAAFI